MIEERISKVWYSSLRNRRFLSKEAAIKAEAIEIYKLKMNEENGGHYHVHAYDIERHEIKEEIEQVKQNILKAKEVK